MDSSQLPCSKPLKTVKLALKLLLSAMFLIAGTIKLHNLNSFLSGVDSFKILPGESPLTDWLGRSLPLLEILCGISLLLPFTETAGFLISILLSTLFLLAYSHSLLLNIHPSCSCFGDIKILQVTPLQGLIRATILITLSIVGYRLSLATKK